MFFYGVGVGTVLGEDVVLTMGIGDFVENFSAVLVEADDGVFEGFVVMGKGSRGFGGKSDDTEGKEDDVGDEDERVVGSGGEDEGDERERKTDEQGDCRHSLDSGVMGGEEGEDRCFGLFLFVPVCGGWVHGDILGNGGIGDDDGASMVEIIVEDIL